MKFKMIIICMALISSTHAAASSEASVIEEKGATLTKIIGDEFLARYAEEFNTCLLKGDLTAAKDILEMIKKDVDTMGCFEISDFFGDQSNKLAKNRDFDMTLWHSIMMDCPDIIRSLEKWGGLGEQVVSYVARNAI